MYQRGTQGHTSSRFEKKQIFSYAHYGVVS